MTERLGALPGVEAVGATSSLPVCRWRPTDATRLVRGTCSRRRAARADAARLARATTAPACVGDGRFGARLLSSAVLRGWSRVLSSDAHPAAHGTRIHVIRQFNFTAGDHHQSGDGRALLVWSEPNWTPDATRTAISVENDHRRGRQYSALRTRRCHSVGVLRALRASGRSATADGATHWPSTARVTVRDAAVL